MPKMNLIWDGEQYLEVSEEEADKLVKEDKAQNLSHKMLSAMELKRKSAFTGYWTREMRASAGLVNDPVEPVDPASEAKTAAKKSKRKTKTN